MMYLPPDGAEALLARLVDRFPSGEVAFDALSERGVRMGGADKAVSATGAKFGWGLDDPEDVKRFAPRLELVAELSSSQFAGFERLPLGLADGLTRHGAVSQPSSVEQAPAL